MASSAFPAEKAVVAAPRGPSCAPQPSCAGLGFAGQSANGSARRRVLRRATRAARGFTLMELMAVTILIAVLAAAAAPSFINVVRDRRVQRAATTIMETYRLARMRALGRGAAVLVRWTDGVGAAGGGLLEVREAITPIANGAVPDPSCLPLGRWVNNSTTSRAVGSFQPGAYELTDATFIDVDANGNDTAPMTVAEICYSPRGRTWIRFASDGATSFTPLNRVPRFDVKNTKSSAIRKVLLPPNGVTRLEL